MLRILVSGSGSLHDTNLLNLLEASPEVTSVEPVHLPELIHTLKNRNELPDAVFLKTDAQTNSQALEAARELYRLNPEIQVQFVADRGFEWDQTLFLEKINLAGILMLPVQEEILARYLKKMDEARKDFSILSIKLHGSEVHLRTDEILYLESSRHQVIIKTSTEEYRPYEKLSDLAGRLPDEFIQTHKSYLVNLARVARVSRNQIQLDNGVNIPISRSRMKQVKEIFVERQEKE